MNFFDTLKNETVQERAELFAAPIIIEALSGKVTLNDYIAAVNRRDSIRFDQVFRDVQGRRLMVEWMRLTDRLVRSEEVLP